MRRENDGFSILELLGVLSFIHNEITQQLSSNIKPDIIERIVTKEPRP
jgi:hypothetical protein